MSIRIHEQEVVRTNIWPISPEDSQQYSLQADHVDVYSLVTETDRLLAQRVSQLESDIHSSIFWGTELPSLKEVDLATQFEPLTGAVILPHGITDQSILDFFEHKSRHYDHRGRVENRGKSYYVAVDPEFIDSQSKIEIMQRDMVDALHVIHHFDRNTASQDDLLGLLGVVDYFKQHALTALHVLTYPERFGNLITDDLYHAYREHAIQLAEIATRMYYQTFLGREYDKDLDFTQLQQETTDLLSFLSQQDRNYRQYTVQEVDHPLRIMAHIQETLRQGYIADTLLALVSGGTQTAIAFQMAYRHLNGKDLPILYVPLSLHSTTINSFEAFSDEQLRAYLLRHEAEIIGKQIQVVEDNANSGQTAQLIHDTLVDLGADSVRLSFVEIDPYRVIYKQRSSAERRSAYIANFMHPDFQTSVGTLPIARSIKQDYQLRKIYVWRLFDAYKGDSM